ncbi:uncharacterized protein FFB20_00959 [Fusarium fujikuroi]|nr:hypothetical protein CEK26_003319 [Fusarium fujikuroi]SCN64742.1 uncharacterized protein FFB20_00959 [Fusarium fujikuroi]SCN70245.1 uncharacterized protein FFE2_01938 [Fusarium fujikuroi]
MDDGDFDLDRIWGVGPEFGGKSVSESESDCAPQSPTIPESESSYEETAQHVSAGGIFDDRGPHVTSRVNSASYEEPRDAPASGHNSRIHETNVGRESKPLDPLLRGARRCASIVIWILTTRIVLYLVGLFLAGAAVWICLLYLLKYFPSIIANGTAFCLVNVLTGIETVAGKVFTTATPANNYQDMASFTFRRPIGLDESEVVPYVLQTMWKSFSIEFPEQAPALKHDYDITFGNYQVLLGLNGKFVNGMEDKTIRTYSRIVALIDQISYDSDDTTKSAPWYSFRSVDQYRLQRARQSRQNLAYIIQDAIEDVEEQIRAIKKATRKCSESGPGLCNKLKAFPDTSWMARDIVAATTVCCKAQTGSESQWKQVEKTLGNFVRDLKKGLGRAESIGDTNSHQYIFKQLKKIAISMKEKCEKFAKL